MTIEDRIAYRKLIQGVLEELWQEAESDDDRIGHVNGCLAFLQQYAPDRIKLSQESEPVSGPVDHDEPDTDQMARLREIYETADLNDWEKTFCSSILRRGDLNLSERQQDCIDKIFEKYD